MEDERASTLSEEEIAERIRSRKARQKWSAPLAVVGLIGVVAVYAAVLFLPEASDPERFWGLTKPSTAEALMLLSPAGILTLVGMGFAEPEKIKGLFR
jgi:peptidoglycan/LPS O-acetylase OafA/YrhL